MTSMTDDTCPTCGPICGMRWFGWTPTTEQQEGRKYE